MSNLMQTMATTRPLPERYEGQAAALRAQGNPGLKLTRLRQGLVKDSIELPTTSLPMSMRGKAIGAAAVVEGAYALS